MSTTIKHTDREAFLRAIREQPGDTALVLIYADWLDEHVTPAVAGVLRLTTDVETAMAFEVGRQLDAIWPAGGRPAWRDETLMASLADALELAGYADQTTLAALRVGDKYDDGYGGTHWQRMPLISRLRDKLAKARQAVEDAALIQAHAIRVAPIVADLEARSKAAYAAKQVSNGYWLAQRAALIAGNPGYVTAEIHDLRGTPPAGTIWIRCSSGGKWSTSRKDKYGRKLTVAELAAKE